MKRSIFIISLMIISTSFSCSCCKNETQKSESTSMEKRDRSLPQAFVYKTKAKYFNNVPVILNSTKTEVIAYPAVSDVSIDGQLQTPTLLLNGYLLDNRGISKDVAFLKLTYEEYSKLAATPTSAELFKLIIDFDPITELYSCGNKNDFKDIESELNLMIKKNFEGCKKIK